MAITDLDQLSEVQWRLVEDVDFSSTLWTRTEVVALFNQWQQRFNRDAKVVLNLDTIVATSGTAEYLLPLDWIATQRASWQSAEGSFSPIERSDQYVQDLLMPAVGAGDYPSVPVSLDDHSGAGRTLLLSPPPQTNGLIWLLYAMVTDPLSFDADDPQDFTIPDEFVLFVCYGVLSDLLSKEGRGHDMARATYCASRYQEGVALAAVLLQGFA